MKKYFSFFLLLVLCLGCAKDTVRNNNPYIPSYSFSFTINLGLPLYVGLKSAMNPIPITEPSGISMIVMKISDTDYRAWNAYCPNQSPSSCSKLTVNGVNAKCSCDALEYSLFTGIGNAQYTMIPYRVEVLGNDAIRVYN
jgi:nitrite reductase/ring-hydroxylating ferredoxin subunit